MTEKSVQLDVVQTTGATSTTLGVYRAKEDSNFRFNAIQVGMTYSQCPLERDRVLSAWLDKFGDNIEQYLIAREKHEDGNFHIHGYIRFLKKVNYKDPRFLDIDGYHPKIERGLKSSKNWIQYCIKEDEEPLANFKLEKKTNPYADTITVLREKNYDAAVDYIIEKNPEAYLKYSNAIELGLRKIAMREKEEEAPRYTLKDFKINFQWNKSKSLILWGPSGIGKTHLAIALMEGPHVFASHIDDLKKFNPAKHVGIIFDDMSFSHLHREAQIHLVDHDFDRTIHVRYGVVEVPKGTKKIFTTNTPGGYVVNIDDPAIMRRTQVQSVETLY